MLFVCKSVIFHNALLIIISDIVFSFINHQNGNTAFMWAAQYGKADIIKLLLKAGASVEAKNNVSKRVFIFTYVCVCVCVRGERYSSIIQHDKCKVSYYSITIFYYNM